MATPSQQGSAQGEEAAYTQPAEKRVVVKAGPVAKGLLVLALCLSLSVCVFTIVIFFSASTDTTVFENVAWARVELPRWHVHIGLNRCGITSNTASMSACLCACLVCVPVYMPGVRAWCACLACLHLCVTVCACPPRSLSLPPSFSASHSLSLALSRPLIRVTYLHVCNRFGITSNNVSISDTSYRYSDDQCQYLMQSPAGTDPCAVCLDAGRGTLGMLIFSFILTLVATVLGMFRCQSATNTRNIRIGTVLPCLCDTRIGAVLPC